MIILEKENIHGLARAARYLARNSAYYDEAKAILEKIYNARQEKFGTIIIDLDQREKDLIIDHYIELVNGVTDLPQNLPSESPLSFELERFKEEIAQRDS